jgi:hypothetical protein
MEDASEPAPPLCRVLLFTGHQADAPGREAPRFPAACESIAREKLRSVIERELAIDPAAPVIGMAGAASGGDILFHEVCAELGIETRVLLALPPAEFEQVSVAPAGKAWVRRYRALLERNPPEIMPSEADKQSVSGHSDAGLWERNNAWILRAALTLGGKRTLLIALWDGRAGDGPGGTRDMIEQARANGARAVIIDTRREFGL